MSIQRRKDNKGRVLKNGESQRKDGSYMYRYADIQGNRKSARRRMKYKPHLTRAFYFKVPILLSLNFSRTF